MQACHWHNKTITAHLLQLFSPRDEKKGVWVASSMSVQTRLMNHSIHSGSLCLFSGSVFVLVSVFFYFLCLSLSFVFIPGYVFVFVYVILVFIFWVCLFLCLCSSFLFSGSIFVFVYVFLFYFDGLSLSLPVSVRKVIFLISDWQRSSHRLLY